MAFGKKIQLFLLDGTPNGRWICELSNWTGTAYKIPRVYVKKCETRTELQAPGVYFLFGKNDETGKDAVYIGEAEKLYNRLKQHVDGKEFWNEAICFISKGDALNKAYIKYLENRFYELAKDNQHYTIENSTVPTKSFVSEADEAELEEFIYNAKILTNTLGHKVFESLSEANDDTSDKHHLYISISSLKAACVQTSEGFVLLKGSDIHNETSKKSLHKGMVKRIEEAKNNGQVKDGKLQEDIVFSSSSAAACFVLGYSVSGPMTWKTKDGKTLKEIES